VGDAGRDSDVAVWLAETTGQDARDVSDDLRLGEQRRAFVLNELVESGYEGELLVSLALRLTGLDEPTVRARVEARERVLRWVGDEAPARDARLAWNEVAFRRRNEERVRIAADEEAPEVIEVVCECSDRACTRTLTLPFAEYEWLRQDPARFVVLPGHEAPAIEDAVERHHGYAIVEKHAETRRQVEGADPRV
jgi:hypothetical protein